MLLRVALAGDSDHWLVLDTGGGGGTGGQAALLLDC